MADTKNSFKQLQELLKQQVKRAAHVTDRLDDGGVSAEGEKGERASDAEADINATYGDLGVDGEKEVNEVNPVGTVPDTSPAKPVTKQPIPDESPDHPTNEPLRDTMKQAVRAYKSAGTDMVQALNQLAALVANAEKSAEDSVQVDEVSTDEPEEKKEDEPEEEKKEEKKEDEPKEEPVVSEETDIAEILDDVSAGKVAAQAVAEMLIDVSTKDDEEVEAGKQAAQAVAELLVEEDEVAKEAALEDVVNAVIKQASDDATVYCDLLDMFIVNQSEGIRKAAGLMMPPTMEEPQDAEGEPNAEELLALLAQLGNGEEGAAVDESGGDDSEIAALLEQAGLLGGEDEEDISPEVKEEVPSEEEEKLASKKATLAKLLLLAEKL